MGGEQNTSTKSLEYHRIQEKGSCLFTSQMIPLKKSLKKELFKRHLRLRRVRGSVLKSGSGDYKVPKKCEDLDLFEVIKSKNMMIQN